MRQGQHQGQCEAINLRGCSIWNEAPVSDEVPEKLLVKQDWFCVLIKLNPFHFTGSRAHLAPLQIIYQCHILLFNRQ